VSLLRGPFVRQPKNTRMPPRGKDGGAEFVRNDIPARVAMMTWHKMPSVFQRYNIVSDGDLREAARKLGLPQSGFHLLRHTFATQYLRAGGDVVRLSIILGHSEVSTTMKYLHLLTEDLQRPRQSLSILNRLR
jgi:integrase